MTKQDVKIFYRFLKDKGLFSVWHYNIKNAKQTYYYRVNANGNYENYLSKVNPKCVIENSFSWVKTKEEYDFWRSADYEWKGYLKAKKSDI